MQITIYSSHPNLASLLSTEKTSSLLGSFFQLANTFEVTGLLESKSHSYEDCVKFEALRNCQNKRWSPFVSLLALSSVFEIEIHSFYPGTGAGSSGKCAQRLCNICIRYS